MTNEQFNALPDRLQIWALRENKALYIGAEVGLGSQIVVKIGLELGKNYPNVLLKGELKNYKSVELGTLIIRQ